MKVSDVMTRRVISVAPEATVRHAIRLMLQNNISGLPVIDDKGKLVGIVSEGDFLRRSEIGTERKRSRWLTAFLGPSEPAHDYVHSHGLKVKEVMTCDPIMVQEDTQLDQVVHLMESHNIKRLPVVRGEKVVGVVSRANLMRALASIHRAAPKSSKDVLQSAIRFFPISPNKTGRPASLSMSLCVMALRTYGAALLTRRSETRSRYLLKRLLGSNR